MPELLLPKHQPYHLIFLSIISCVVKAIVIFADKIAGCTCFGRATADIVQEVITEIKAVIPNIRTAPNHLANNQLADC